MGKRRQSNIRQEVARLWRSTARGSFSQARRAYGARELNRRAARVASDVRTLLPIHLALFEEGIHALYALSRVYSSTWWPKNRKERPLFWFFVHRQVALLAAIRSLALTGFSESAYGLARTFLETTDVAIVLAGDGDFRKLFAYWRRGFDDNDFWKREIGYGRIHRRVGDVLRKLGFSTKEVEGWFRLRKLQNRRLSASIHPSSGSAMFNTVVPSLVYPGKFKADPLGHASTFTTTLLGVITMETFRFVSLVIQLILSRTSPMLPTHDPNRFNCFFVAALVLQEEAFKYEDVLIDRTRRRT